MLITIEASFLSHTSALELILKAQRVTRTLHISCVVYIRGLFRRCKSRIYCRMQNLHSPDPLASTTEINMKWNFLKTIYSLFSTKIISVSESVLKGTPGFWLSIGKISSRFSGVGNYYIGFRTDDSLPCNWEAFMWKAEQISNRKSLLFSRVRSV